MGQLIEDIFHAAFDNDWLRAGNDQSAFDVDGRAHGDDDRRLCRLAALLSRRRHRLARRARHDQRHRDGGRASALSLGELHHRGGLPARRSQAHRRRAWARRRARRACRSSPATPRSSSAARPTACSSRPPASASRRLASGSPATRRGRAISSCCSGTIGDHGVAVMSKRENLEFETQILSDSAALHGLVAAMVAAGGAGVRVMRDPTRGGLAATLNELAHQSRRRLRHRGGGDPGARRGRGGVRISRARSAQRRQRRQARRDRRAGRRRGGARGDEGPSARRPTRRSIGRVVEDANRFVEMRTAFGGGRIVDWLSGEQLPRIC